MYLGFDCCYQGLSRELPVAQTSSQHLVTNIFVGNHPLLMELSTSLKKQLKNNLHRLINGWECYLYLRIHSIYFMTFVGEAPSVSFVFPRGYVCSLKSSPLFFKFFFCFVGGFLIAFLLQDFKFYAT